MPAIKELSALFTILADLFRAEGRPGALQAAAALRQSDLLRTELCPNPDFELTGTCKTALALRPHPAAAAVADALPHISWHFSGLDDGRIRPDIARAMCTAELIGPDGLFEHSDVCVGLFMQSANLDYVTRQHRAEETFIMLGGSGYWSCNGSAAKFAQAGDMLFHPSNAPHISITKSEPLIAAWRWTGDIGWGGYKLIG